MSYPALAHTVPRGAAMAAVQSRSATKVLHCELTGRASAERRCPPWPPTARWARPIGGGAQAASGQNSRPRSAPFPGKTIMRCSQSILNIEF